VTALALLADALAFLWIFDVQGWNLTRSAAIAGEVGILLTVLLHDLWTFAGRAARSSLDRFRRLAGVQLALGVLLFLRLLVINALVNWFGLGPMAAFLVALAAVTPASHLLGSRLTWRGVRS
jgi:putative flippase GtrA